MADGQTRRNCSATATPAGTTGLGAEIEAGKHSFKSLEKIHARKKATAHGRNRSGRQEDDRKTLINTYV